MTLSVHHNSAAIFSHAQLLRSERDLSSAIERLSSGIRIHRAADDPDGLVIANNLRHHLTGLEQASENMELGTSMVQTAEGSMDEISNLLNRARSLAIEAANEGPNTPESLVALQEEIDNVINSISEIAGQSQWGRLKLLDGTLTDNDIATAGRDDWRASSFDFTRLPGGVQDGSTIDIGVPSTASLGRSSATVTLTTDGVTPAPGTTALNGLQQNGTVLSIAGASDVTITGPLGTATVTVTPTTAVADFVALVNIETPTTGVRANYDATTGALTLEGENFGTGALTIESVAMGTEGLLDDAPGVATSNTYTGVRDTFSSTFAGPPLATDPIQGQTVDGTLLDAVDGGRLSFFSDGTEYVFSPTATTTIQDVVDWVNNQTNSGLNATYDGVTGELAITASNGPLQIASSDLTSGGLGVGLLDDNTSNLGTNGRQTADAGNPTVDVSWVDRDGTTRTVTLTQIPSRDGGLTFTNLLPGPENTEPYTGWEPGAIILTAEDTSDGSFGSSTTLATLATTATRRSTINIQTGALTGQRINIDLIDARAGALGGSAGLAADGFADLVDIVDSQALRNLQTTEAIQLIDAAIDEISLARGRLGAVQSNALETNLGSVRVAIENLTASESQIRDTDFAAESAEYARTNILYQAATAMLAQANQTPNSVLQLLQ